MRRHRIPLVSVFGLALAFVSGPPTWAQQEVAESRVNWAALAWIKPETPTGTTTGGTFTLGRQSIRIVNVRTRSPTTRHPQPTTMQRLRP